MAEGEAAQALKFTGASADPNAQLRIRAAWIYHVEGRTQNEVAQALGLNRVAVTRLLSEARRKGEVSIRINAPLTALVALERRLEDGFGLSQAVVAPFGQMGGDPTKVIAAAAGAYVSRIMEPNTTVGVGWGRTLHASLPFTTGRPLPNLSVVSLLGGIAQARRFNPAEFAWQFAELFDGEGFLVPAPALVDSAQTKLALIERCGLDQIFAMAEASDLALVSAGGIANLTTSYRLGSVTEDERRSLEAAGAVGDVLYNFIDKDGGLVDHPVNQRAVSLSLDALAKVPRKVLVSGGPEKLSVLRACLGLLRPTTLITDECTANALLTR